jgi:hypothetical protein
MEYSTGKGKRKEKKIKREKERRENMGVKQSN